MVENTTKTDDAKVDSKVADSKVAESKASSSLYSEVNKEREQTKSARGGEGASPAGTAADKYLVPLDITGDDKSKGLLAVNKLTTDGADSQKGGDKSEVTGDKTAARSAKDIDDSLHWYKQDEYDKINQTLQGKKPEEIAAIDGEFQKTHDGHTIKEVLHERWQGKHDDKLKEIDELLSPKETPKDVAANPTMSLEAAAEIKAREAQAKAEALESIKKDPEIASRHEALDKRARETMKEPELKEFRSNMQKFEDREAGVQSQYEKEFLAKGMNADDAKKSAEQEAHKQIEKSYENVTKLLEKNESAPVNQKDRIVLAQQAMEHAADPYSISQGAHNTCNAATVETRTYTKDPAEATRVISEVGTTGRYTREGKPTITLDSNSLQRQGEAQEAPKNRMDGHRDYASQLYQVTAVNVELDKRNHSTNPPGQIRYEQHKPIPGQNPEDTGERLMDYSGGKPKEIGRDPDVIHSEIADMAKEMSPRHSDGPTLITSFDGTKLQKQLVDIDMRQYKLNDGKPIDLSDAEWAKKAHAAVDSKEDLAPTKKHEINKHIDELEKRQKADQTGDYLHVNNEQEMRDSLTKLKHEGKLPVIVTVNCQNEPFWSDCGGGQAGGSGGSHVVTVTDYDESTGKAKMQNQWESTSSHDISAKQLFEATKRESIESLQDQVDAGKKSGQRDFNKEYELLRFKHDQSKMSDADYDKELSKITIERFRQFKSGQIKDDDEYRLASRQAKNMIQALQDSNDPADKKRAEQILKEVGDATKGS